MKILCLNCRGLGQPEAVQEVRSLCQLQRPMVVFLSETRLFYDNVDHLKRSLGFPNGVGVGCFGRGSGLALLWTRDADIKLNSYDKLHIDVTVLDPSTQEELWRFTGFYGESRRELRHRSWERMRWLKNFSSLPWLCAGDFNETLDASEQFGGLVRPERQMDGFREAVSECGFTDLGFIGLPYTWDNRQHGSHNIKVRLDRGLATRAFLDMFHEVRVTHIQTTESDHCALLIECTKVRQRRGRRRNFRYENMWRRDPTCMDTVEKAWTPTDRPATLLQVRQQLGRVQGSLQIWEDTVFGSVRKEMTQRRKELERVRAGSIGMGPSSQERRLMARISKLLSREECMEKQRSRIDWLKEGDRNTALLQAKARERARSNKIKSLRRNDGSIAVKQEEIEEVATSFYRDLFSAQTELETGAILHHVQRRVSEEINESLTTPYTAEEVRKAVFMMGPNKAPGPGGLTAGFFQVHWDLIGAQVSDAVLNFLNGGIMPDDLNLTTIVLIPKCKNPVEMKQFRPISLCNVLYKICSKVLANRLRGFLDEIISEEQSAFVLGRLITDNVLIAYECIHYLKRKKGKSGACAVKLDMAKAYDRVEWEYLEGIMLILGFHGDFVSRIMRCVPSVSFCVRTNGALAERFRPTRGIRQGDPISPYLFLLCSEGLSCLLRGLGPRHISRGVRVSVHAPWVSHLLFADDCIVFTEASQRGADRLKEVLETYNRGSGQMVNREKSAIFFSKNCSSDAKKEVQQCLDIRNVALAEKYLGLPTSVGRATKEVFEYMPAKVKGLIGSWSGREASCAGREVLLKSIAQAVPTYSMSCFLLPADTCKKMRQAIANYWWGSSADNRHIHWLRWEHLTWYGLS